MLDTQPLAVRCLPSMQHPALPPPPPPPPRPAFPLWQIWRYGELGWQEEESLPGHTDWVRDVAWAPNMGLPKNTIASCGQDGQVYVWGERPNGGWERKLVHDFKVPVWRVSWSMTGNILAVSDGNNAVTLWKETIDGVWQQVSQ